MMQIFTDTNIQVIGTVTDPLFNTRDVAAHIDDDNYRRNVRGYTSEFMTSHPFSDKLGRSRTVLFFTEGGLYRYLTQSRKDKAISFQRQVYEILKHERRRVVDDAMLSAKIANMRLQQTQQELTDCISAKEALEEECAELESHNDQLERILESVPGWSRPRTADAGLTASGIELFLSKMNTART